MRLFICWGESQVLQQGLDGRREHLGHRGRVRASRWLQMLLQLSKERGVIDIDVLGNNFTQLVDLIISQNPETHECTPVSGTCN